MIDVRIIEKAVNSLENIAEAGNAIAKGLERIAQVISIAATDGDGGCLVMTGDAISASIDRTANAIQDVGMSEKLGAALDAFVAIDFGSIIHAVLEDENVVTALQAIASHVNRLSDSREDRDPNPGAE